MGTALHAATVVLLAAISPLQAQQSVDESGVRMDLEALLATPVTAASRYEQSAREAPASVTIITAAEIEEMGYETISEALASQPGFFQSHDRTFAFVGMRGFQRPGDLNNRILLLLDGHVVNDPVTDAAQLGDSFILPIETLQRIEIARGPGSSTHGGNAMFAVVNVVTRDATTRGGANVEARIGSVGQRRLLASYGTDLSREGGLLLAAEFREEDGEELYFPELDDPRTNLGRSVGSDWTDKKSIFAKGSYGSGRLSAGYVEYEKGVPTGPGGSLLNQGSRFRYWSFFTHAAQRLSVSDDFHVDLAGSFNQGEFDTGWKMDAPRNWFFQGGAAAWFAGQATAQWDPGIDTRIAMGIDSRNDIQAEAWGRDDETEYADQNAPAQRAGLFVQAERQLTRDLGVTVGARHDWHSAGFNGWSPRIAVIYHPASNQTLKLLYGQAFRAPSLSERTEDDFYRANSDLKQETIRTAEVWWEGRVRRGLWVQATAYQYWLRGLIERGFDNQTGFFFYDNVEDVRARGAEIRLNGEHGRVLSWYVSGAVQRAENQASSLEAGTWDRVENSPLRTLRAGVVVRLPSSLFLSGQLSHESGRQTKYGDQTDSFLVLDTKLGAPRLIGGLGLEVVAKNLFDAPVSIPVGWNYAQRTLPQPGRRIHFALTLGH